MSRLSAKSTPKGNAIPPKLRERRGMNYDKVFKVFGENYKLVPLEIFTAPYESLVSTVLSARTRDSLTVVICKNLFKKAPDLKSLSKLKEEKIAKLIHGVAFYKIKAKHLKKLSQIILEDYKGVIPSTREKLVKLPGVGRKTANLVINRTFATPAIAVDTHVHSISNMLGWVNTKNPEKTEVELMRILPKKYWKDTNRFFVSIGQQYRSQKKVLEFLKKENLV